MCGMLSSLQAWNPSLPLNLSMLRKATATKGKVIWTNELEVEYQNAVDIMKTRIELSPYDPTKRLRIIIDGAKTVGTVFILCQYLNEENPSKGVKIIHAGADKFEPGKDYSPVEAEAIALSRAIEACHSDPIMLFSDCKGLLDMMEKPLADISNLKIQKILEKAQNYHWETVHISSEENEICDALSRLCTSCLLYTSPSPRDS